MKEIAIYLEGGGDTAQQKGECCVLSASLLFPNSVWEPAPRNSVSRSDWQEE